MTNYAVLIYQLIPYNFIKFLFYRVDFGEGGAVFVDGILTHSNPRYLWWDQDFNSPTGVFRLNLPLNKGSHCIVIYGYDGKFYFIQKYTN